MRIRTIGLSLLGVSLLSCGPSPAKRSDAMDAFTRDAEPEITRAIEGFLFTSPMPVTWTGPAKFGMQDGSNPMDNPYGRGDRIVRSGTLPNGATFFGEAFYSYKDSRIQSITVVADFPDTRTKKPVGNEPITRELLASVQVNAPLIDELLKGIGKGSMSGSGDLSFEALTEVSGKRVEASTAIHRGTPLRLELSCSWYR